jgi:hypothetical protein
MTPKRKVCFGRKRKFSAAKADEWYEKYPDAPRKNKDKKRSKKKKMRKATKGQKMK